MRNLISQLNLIPSEKRLYALQNIPSHLASAGKIDRLNSLLENIDFISSKIASFGPQSILEDYSIALDPAIVSLPDNMRNYLNILQGAIRMSSAALTEDAQETYSQLYARLHSHDAFRDILITYKPNNPWLRILSDTMSSSGGLLIRTLVGHTNVLGCTLSKDGKTALSVSEDHTMRIWNLDTGQSEVLLGHSGPIKDCSLSVDGRLALSASFDKTLRLWDINDKGVHCRYTLAGHKDRVVGCALSQDGRLALSASHDKTARVWNTNTGECILIFVEHKDKLTCCALSSNGKYALTGSHDTTLRFWDTKTGKCFTVIDDFLGAIISCDISGDGRVALTACSTLLIGDDEPDDIPKSKIIPIKTYYIENSDSEKDATDNQNPIDIAQDDSWENIMDYLNSIPDLQQILKEERTLRLWDIKTGKCTQIIKEHDASIMHCELSKDAKYVLSTALDGSMRIWNSQTSECQAILGEAGMHVSSGALNMEKNLALSAPFTGNLRLWNVKGAVETQAFQISKISRSAFIGGGYSKDNKYAISCSFNFEIQIWDAQTGISLETIDISNKEIVVNEFDVSVDSKLAIIITDYIFKKDKDVRVIDLNNGQIMHTLTGHTSGISACSMSLDGKIAISASYDKTIRAWDIINGKLLHIMEGHNGEVESCALSWDGQLAVSASEDATLRLWHTIHGKCLHILKGHTEKIISCRLSGNGLRILSISEDQTLRMWDVRSGQCIGILELPSESVQWCALDLKGELCIYMPSPQKIQLIDFSSRQKIVSFTFDNNIRSPIFAPNRKSIMVGDMSGQIYFLRLENIRQI